MMILFAMVAFPPVSYWFPDNASAAVRANFGPGRRTIIEHQAAFKWKHQPTEALGLATKARALRQVSAASLRIMGPPGVARGLTELMRPWTIALLENARCTQNTCRLRRPCFCRCSAPVAHAA